MNHIEFFAGCGGLLKGMEEAGFHSFAALEINKEAINTLKNNFPNCKYILNEDITKFSFSKKDLPIIIHNVSGGFPCQSFSVAGKQLGFEDTRGTLFFEFARQIKELQPLTFIAENVKGLKNHDNGKTFQTILNVFNELGYEVYWEVLNAKDYLVPQKRERLFFVGIRRDIFNKNKKPFIFPQKQIQKVLLKDILIDCPHSRGASYNKKKQEMFSYVSQGGYWRDIPDEKRDYFLGENHRNYTQKGGSTGMAKRLSMEDFSPTLCCSPQQKMTERCHPLENRPLTIREYARIQTFPDNFEFHGSIANQYKQIGNAVPVKLAYFIGLELKKYLEAIEL